MATQLLITHCGCVSLLVGNLQIIDWNRLPDEDIQVGWLVLGGTEYPIATSFEDKEALLEYLNSTFVEDNDLDGIFLIEGEYTNPENFSNAEIMAILETTMIRFKIGTPLATLNLPTIDVANGNVITDASLVGVEILQVTVGSINAEPITASGWEGDSVDGTLTFPSDNYPQDTFVYVLVKQEN